MCYVTQMQNQVIEVIQQCWIITANFWRVFKIAIIKTAMKTKHKLTTVCKTKKYHFLII